MRLINLLQSKMLHWFDIDIANDGLEAVDMAKNPIMILFYGFTNAKYGWI